MTRIEDGTARWSRESSRWIIVAPGVIAGADAGDVVNVEVQRKGEAEPEMIRARIIGHRSTPTTSDGWDETLLVPVRDLVAIAAKTLASASGTAFHRAREAAEMVRRQAKDRAEIESYFAAGMGLSEAAAARIEALDAEKGLVHYALARALSEHLRDDFDAALAYYSWDLDEHENDWTRSEVDSHWDALLAVNSTDPGA